MLRLKNGSFIWNLIMKAGRSYPEWFGLTRSIKCNFDILFTMRNREYVHSIAIY